MPANTPAPVSADEVRAAIDFESEYVVHLRDGDTWVRPQSAEHRQLHGIDVWHTVRRSGRYEATMHLFEQGVLTLASTSAAVRFIPAAVYEEHFCSAEDCEESTDDGEGWEGLCGNCADRAEAESEEADATTPPGPSALTTYTTADLHHAAATVHHMLLLALDSQSGVGESLCDQPIPHTAGTDEPRTWQSLGDEAASTAYRAVGKLVDEAPDLSGWAIGLAAEHLVPEPDPLTRWEDDEASIRVHLAFADHVTADRRAAIRDALRLVLRSDI
ncbi:hypothetical protein [Streptomyces sp. NRRL S-350]|uniref:hypothetical protein n=1 Tax=Streptomyces sp. NRRL S-350 TaxID=1463902 RepID=UPI0004C16914|nr:hypothetical protein [Streptomyces sp. NRRL S-350]